MRERVGVCPKLSKMESLDSSSATKFPPYTVELKSNLNYCATTSRTAFLFD